MKDADAKPDAADEREVDPLLFTVEETAKVLRCSPSQVRNLIDYEELPLVYLGKRQRRIPRAALEEWVANRVVVLS